MFHNVFIHLFIRRKGLRNWHFIYKDTVAILDYQHNVLFFSMESLNVRMKHGKLVFLKYYTAKIKILSAPASAHIGIHTCNGMATTLRKYVGVFP